MDTPQELIERYRDAFTRGDLPALVDFFGFPLQVVAVTDAASTSVLQRDEWAGVLNRLLDTYKQLGVVGAFPTRTRGQPANGSRRHGAGSLGVAEGRRPTDL